MKYRIRYLNKNNESVISKEKFTIQELSAVYGNGFADFIVRAYNVDRFIVHSSKHNYQRLLENRKKKAYLASVEGIIND